MEKSLLRFEKIKIWEFGVMLFYIILSVAFLFFLKLAKSETQNSYLTAYAVSGQLLLYTILYKSLRNFKVYIFWLIISLFHLCLYFLLKENGAYIKFHNNHIVGLRNTFILIILFQILRFVSLKIQNQELVSIGRSKTDIYDQRETTKTDNILYLVYIVSTFLLLTIK
jgi:hypothetical protein